MMWRHVLLAGAMAVGSAAGAQAQKIESRPLPPLELHIAGQDCQWLDRHPPSADGDYKPGVSTTGRPVAPADLGGRPPLQLPDTYTLSIGREILDLPGNTKADLAVGEVRLDVATRRVFFNGQPISAAAENELVALCRAKLRRGN